MFSDILSILTFCLKKVDFLSGRGVDPPPDLRPPLPFCKGPFAVFIKLKNGKILFL